MFSEKVVKLNKPKKYAKNGRFLAQEDLFLKKKKSLCASLTFDPKKLYTKFQQNPYVRFADIALRTDGRTDGRTDRRE